MEVVEKKRQIVKNILNIMEFYSYPESFLKMIMFLLQLDDHKTFDKQAAIDKIITIYDTYNQRYQIHLQKTKFENILSDVKDFLKNVFKKYDEKINYQIKDNFANRQPSMFFEDPSKFNFRQNPFATNPMSMNMNMSNTFLQVPSNMSTEEIQIFQRKMYELCKNAMPQILSSLPSNQANLYSSFSMFNPYNNFNSFSKPDFYPDFNRMQNPSMNKFAAETTLGKMGFNPPNKGFSNEQKQTQISSHSLIPPPLEGEGEKKNFYSQKNIGFDFPQKDISEFSQTPISQRYAEKFEYEEPRKKTKRDREENYYWKDSNFKCQCDEQNLKDCPYCIIKNLNPLHEVKDVIFMQKIQNFQSTPIHCWVTENFVEKYMKDKENYDIEIRCMRIDESEDNEIRWPDNCQIEVNGESILKMESESSLKKRKDHSFVFSKEMEEKSFKLREKIEIKIQLIKEERDSSNTNSVPFLFAIFFVQKYSTSFLYDSIKKNIKQYSIDDQFHNEDGINPEKITLSPKDHLMEVLMKDPVKGQHCLHPQCFDLKNFLSFAPRAKQWKCPLCSKGIKKFRLNKDLMKHVEEISRANLKEPKQICFYKSGEYAFKYELEKKEEGQQDEKNKES